MDEREYTEMKRQYRSDMDKRQAQVEQLEQQLSNLSAQTVKNPWLQNFSQFSDETRLTENMAHTLIQRIEVDADKNITVHLKYRDEYAGLARLLGVEAGL